MRTGEFTGFSVTLRNPGIAWIQFNTPERLNGLTHRIKRDLVETINQAQMDNAVRVMVFTGSGRAFCAGDDISGQKKPISGEPLMPPIPAGHDNEIGTYEGLRHLSQTLNLALRNCDKIAIAAVNGIAIQTGMTLALACDFALAFALALFLALACFLRLRLFSFTFVHNLRKKQFSFFSF